MPIFEYRCGTCNHRFETIVLAKHERITCPKCQSSALEKQLSVFSSPVSGQGAAASTGSGACTPQTCGYR